MTAGFRRPTEITALELAIHVFSVQCLRMTETNQKIVIVFEPHSSPDTAPWQLPQH
jgi:hypothetical protein